MTSGKFGETSWLQQQMANFLPPFPEPRIHYLAQLFHTPVPYALEEFAPKIEQLPFIRGAGEYKELLKEMKPPSKKLGWISRMIQKHVLWLLK